MVFAILNAFSKKTVLCTVHKDEVCTMALHSYTCYESRTPVKSHAISAHYETSQLPKKTNFNPSIRQLILELTIWFLKKSEFKNVISCHGASRFSFTSVFRNSGPICQGNI